MRDEQQQVGLIGEADMNWRATDVSEFREDGVAQDLHDREFRWRHLADLDGECHGM